MAVTIETKLSALSSDPVPGHAPVGIVEGSAPQISSETATLLRTRLRIAAGFMFLAFGLFFGYRILAEVSGAHDPLSFFAHFAATITLGASFVLLCRRCSIHLGKLRAYELAVFGMPSIYLLIQQHDMLMGFAHYEKLPSLVAPWMGISFMYAMFIPNTWRRAAVILGILCAMPLLLTTYLFFADPQIARALAVNAMFVIELIILMGVTYGAATYGTHVINQLRNEAFEAKRLGQYRLCHLIGSGGMGEVYLAEHQLMKRPVAIKLIRPGKAADPQALARFEREVRATAKLSHWNTIEIFDYGRTEDGTFYYVMEYLPGLSLHDLVEKHGALPPARVAFLLMQTCDALAEAHSHGLVHRDLKPGNIFSAQRGGYYDVAKLLDFGLAKPLSDETESPHLTQDGSITGSPLFMAPEQAIGDIEPDERCDIYSLGAVAYYLLTGVPPFVGDKALKIIMAHAHEPVVPPSQLKPHIPRDLEQVVMRCLAKKPNDRFTSALALRSAFADCVAAGGWTHGDAAKWWHINGSTNAHVAKMTASAI